VIDVSYNGNVSYFVRLVHPRKLSGPILLLY
jgi:hypothetical protein